jgi:hypothetical protein
MSSTAARAQAKAFAKKRAEKERRQVVLVVVLVVVLLAVMAFELPKLLRSSGSSSTSAPPAAVPAPATPSAATPSRSSAALRAVMKQSSARDVFQRPQITIESTLGSVAPPPGLHDPFASPRSIGSEQAPAAPAPPVQVTSLPGTIVLGTPGPGKVAVQGWIVILASIPAGDGQAAAQSFSAKARNAGVTSVSVLNSSSQKPLRGGYWVVYTGPYASLAQVSTAATNVHAAGFGTAYIRELLVYKAKQGGAAPATKTTTKKSKTKKKR